jgi:hypothetical protein
MFGSMLRRVFDFPDQRLAVGGYDVCPYLDTMTNTGCI